MTVSRFPIEAGHVMLFARAVGADDALYFDAMENPDEQGPIYAPPTFVQASRQFEQDYALRPRPGKPWFGSGKEPSGVPEEERQGRGGSLHAEQHFTYERAVRVGDVLRSEQIEGDSWTKEGRRGGTLHFHEVITKWFDEKGELVVTTRHVGVTPGKTVEGA